VQTAQCELLDLAVVSLGKIALHYTIITFQFANTVFLENACVQTPQCDLLDFAVVSYG